ncbi:MAG: hypothetical protein QF609_09055 [Gammaproteobacteria bacterium]|nr:hypothetical protein [Gammaproteobacteria bacterium]
MWGDIDLDEIGVRGLNERLHQITSESTDTCWRIKNPHGLHSIAVGANSPVTLVIEGHVGYYCAGMNKLADITIAGHAGVGVAENIMSGVVRVEGNASSSAGATGRGGLLVIKGDASSRCGISMKGVDIVVGGSVGHMSAFMAQAGRLVVCGDAGSGLGDSIYEAEIFVRGSANDLGADCIMKEMSQDQSHELASLLKRAGLDHDPASFRLYGSARNLYNFHIDHAASY